MTAILALDAAKLEQWTALTGRWPAPSLDLEGSVDRALPPKREEEGWTYGTPYWDALMPERRIELLWLEHAHTISAMIWFKEGLTPLYTRLMQKYGERIAPEVRDYMRAFCEEEAEHTRMLHRYLELAGLPLYERPDLLGLIPMIERVHPIAGILCTYLVQGTIEEMLRDGDGLDPLTRQLYAKHRLDEARHLAFGRWLCESTLENASHATKMRVGHLTRGYMGHAIRRFTYHPEISRYAAFATAVDAEDVEALERLRRSPNNLRLNQERYGPMLEWVRRLGIVKPSYDWSAIDEGILPLAHFSRWSQNGPFSAAGVARRRRAAEGAGRV